MAALIRRLRVALLGSATVIVLGAAQLLRQPGEPTWNTIWAEDGRIYATDALASDWGSSVFRGYAGYIQVVPRLLALPLRVLPAQWWAAWLAGVAVTVTAVLALFVYRMAATVLPSRPLRAVVAGMAALLPAMWFETNANVANLGWPLLYAAFWALIGHQRSRADVLSRGVVLVGAALSTTLAALYAPLALAVAWRRRADRRELWLAGLFLAALVVQAIADQFAPQRPEQDSEAGELPTLFAVRVLGSAAFGERGLDRLWSHFHGALALGLAALAVAAAVALWKLLPRAELRLPAVASALALVLFVVPVWIRGTADMRLGAAYNPSGSRYVVVPVLFVITAVAVGLQRLGYRWLQWLVVAQSVVVVVAAFGLANIRSEGPGWDTGLDAARHDCGDRGDASAFIVVTPPVEPWHVETTCARVR